MQKPKKVMSLYELTKAVDELLDAQIKMSQLAKSMLQTNESVVRSIQLLTDKLTKKGVTNEEATNISE
jgi:hypothetical protein